MNLPPYETTWCGDDDILPDGTSVTVLAHDDTGRTPARHARWVRGYFEGDKSPVYRSCDAADLECFWEDE